MFTGLAAELGSVERLVEGDSFFRLTVRAQKILTDLKIGDSVAVNGVCLTVTDLNSNRGFTADVMPETVRRTTLYRLQPGDPVNLERSLRLMDGLDGHIVQGHVESVGQILSVTPEGNALLYQIATSPDILRYIVEKGSVAVDGISLTVTHVTAGQFGVSLIPHTAKMTTLGHKHAGDPVNLETDILARYVEKMLGLNSGEGGGGDASAAGKGGRSEQAGNPAVLQGSTAELTRDFLQKNGF